MNFDVEKVDVVGNVHNGIPLPYQHGEVDFQFAYEKKIVSL